MNKEENFSVLRAHVAEIMGLEESEFVIEDSLKDLGANSIDRMDIIVETMEELGIKIPMVNFGKCKNMKDIVDIYYAEIVGE